VRGHAGRLIAAPRLAVNAVVVAVIRIDRGGAARSAPHGVQVRRWLGVPRRSVFNAIAPDGLANFVIASQVTK